MLNSSGFFAKKSATDEFKVKLPTVLNFYADYNIVKRVSVTAFLQQKMGDQTKDDQMTSQNMFTLTPRVTFGAFEAFLPVPRLFDIEETVRMDEEEKKRFYRSMVLPALLVFNASNSKISQKKSWGAITISIIRVDYKTV